MGDAIEDIPTMLSLVPLGDRAFLARFATEGEAARWVRAVRREAWTGVEDVVLAYESAAVYADPGRVSLEELEARLRKVTGADPADEPGLLVRLPVLYDGPDLAEVALRLALAEAEVIAHHAGTEYRVYAIGFAPGFPYAGYLPPALSGLPRRSAPRRSVPAGSVAIAGRQTGVYSVASPGGWHLIGRTPLSIVDLEKGHFPIRAGDRIGFEAIDRDTFDARLGELLQRPPVFSATSQ